MCRSHHGTTIWSKVSSPYLFFNNNFCYISKWALQQFFIFKFVSWWWLEAFKEHASPEFLVLSHYNALNYKIASLWVNFNFSSKLGIFNNALMTIAWRVSNSTTYSLLQSNPKKIFNKLVKGNELEIIQNQC